MQKFTKSEIKKFDQAIEHIRESFVEDGHDAHSAMYCSGITFASEIKRFMSYAEMKQAHDVVDTLASENAHKLSATTQERLDGAVDVPKNNTWKRFEFQPLELMQKMYNSEKGVVYVKNDDTAMFIPNDLLQKIIKDYK